MLKQLWGVQRRVRRSPNKWLHGSLGLYPGPTPQRPAPAIPRPRPHAVSRPQGYPLLGAWGLLQGGGQGCGDRAGAVDRGTPDPTRGKWDPDGAVLAWPRDPTAVPARLESSVGSHHTTPVHSHHQLTKRSPVSAAYCGKGDSKFIPEPRPFPCEISFSTPVGT